MLPCGGDVKAVVSLVTCDRSDGELAVGDVEGADVVGDEGRRLLRRVVVMLPGERQRRGVDGVRKLRLVARVAGDIDRPAHDQQERDRRCTEEDEDVAPLVRRRRRKASQRTRT